MPLPNKIANQWPIKIRSADSFFGFVGSGVGDGTPMCYELKWRLKRFEFSSCHQQLNSILYAIWWANDWFEWAAIFR